MFITFEGLDGAGKTTQLHLVAEELRKRGYDVLESREPGGTSFAETVRSLVLNPDLPLNNTTQSLLYLAARSEHVEKVLRPAVEAGKIVLCDRFGDSTMVYQGYVPGRSEEELAILAQLNSFASFGLVPDLTLVLDGSPEVLLTRRTQRGVLDRYELQGLDFQEKLRAGFQKLAAAEPERIHLVNAEGTQEEVFTSILAEVQAVLQDKGFTEER